MAKALMEGDAAPDFTLPTDTGEPVSLKKLKGRKVILYFYPKDNTSGCTKEAIAFSDEIEGFAAAGATVIGVSKDSVKSHGNFREKHGLTIGLGADEDGETVEAYGAWVEKSMYGRKYMGIDRSTFLIDGKGTIRRIWRKVKVPGHIQEVLAAVRDL